MAANRLMKLIYAARFAGVTFLAAGIYSMFVLQPIYGLMLEGQQQSWLVEVLPRWNMGGWLLLLSVLAWMTLLVTSMYNYSPVHRVSTIMQSGLIIIAAVLLMLGILVGLTRLEVLAAGIGGLTPPSTVPGIAFLDDSPLAVLKAGLLMGGGVSAWIGIDLALMGKLPPLWLAPQVIAGVVLVPAPFIGLSAWQLLIALAGLIVFCLVLGARRTLPASYPPLG